ncbi:hypothetical protein POM88_027856 [Heracleum sosnowskyi]|uniref:Calcineurin-like phosphoesterase domain-containing protein n=1 Tax=Heracleum sosnowskyi TaxID=360622 RepID=A0AAD8I8D5_9APIA|nr:hypothetical protein POM88_027856 [Heracleum sosnowskyi]
MFTRQKSSQGLHKKIKSTLFTSRNWRPPANRTPIKVFGDLHGQFDDLMHLFDEYGFSFTAEDISYIDYLFLGDYVNREHQSLETIINLHKAIGVLWTPLSLLKFTIILCLKDAHIFWWPQKLVAGNSTCKHSLLSQGVCACLECSGTLVIGPVPNGDFTASYMCNCIVFLPEGAQFALRHSSGNHSLGKKVVRNVNLQ